MLREGGNWAATFDSLKALLEEVGVLKAASAAGRQLKHAERPALSTADTGWFEIGTVQLAACPPTRSRRLAILTTPAAGGEPAAEGDGDPAGNPAGAALLPPGLRGKGGKVLRTQAVSARPKIARRVAHSCCSVLALLG